MKRAAEVGKKLGRYSGKYLDDPDTLPIIKSITGMCPECNLNLVELRKDMTVACACCDTDGKFEHIFGENVITWNEFSAVHARTTRAGARLHFKHINFSQFEESQMIENPGMIDAELKPYVDYGKIVTP